MTRYRTYAAAALLLAASLGAAACGGDDDSDDSARDSTSTTSEDDSDTNDGDSHDRDDYVAIMGGGGEGFTAEEAACVAGALVDAIGVEALEAAGAYEQIRANPDGNLGDYGITLDEAQGTAFYQASNSCKDLRGFFADEVAADGSVPPEAATCIVNALDDATFQRIWVIGFTDGDDAVSSDPQVTAALTQAATDCAAVG